MKVFDGIQSFFGSIGEYVKNFSTLFLIFVGAFLLVSVVVIFITSFAYECMLTKTVDKINKFFERNPRINDDNLVAFNNLMKGRDVPKTLRRQWQQFMLYREHPASYYMSFQHCVENPLRNSTYRQQMTVYKIISYILVALSLVVSTFMAVQSVNANLVLQDIIIIPTTILLGYWLVSMVLNLVHNATSGDLFQNYQYFEINLDKAMLTLPEFVDYEVLFSQEEIKRGIPVLFAYLQKRAVQEQQELEKARLKSVDHEKFDFDEAGLDGSLVLDRAMREVENFSAQRKKYLQETERVNNEISVSENNYKEQVKEYQRQVQTSRETVENLKSQLEQAASTIEINYIKKQMRDEINRQQLAEKEFDITTDKHNQELKTLNQEIKHYDEETKKAKQALEAAMLSEFNTYSVKVYNNLEKIVDEKMQDKVDDYKDQIKGLEGQLEEKNEELENVYTRYQEALSQVPEEAEDVGFEVQESKPKKKKSKKGSADEMPEDEGMVIPEYMAEDQYDEYDANQFEQNDNYNYDDQYLDDAYQDEWVEDDFYFDQNEDQQYYDDNYDQAGYDDQYQGEEYGAEQGYDQYVPVEDQQYGDDQYAYNDEYANDQYDQYVPIQEENANTQPYQESEYTEQYVPLDNNNNQEFEYVPLDQEQPSTTTDVKPEPKNDEKEENGKSDSTDFDESDFEFDFDFDSSDKKSAVSDEKFDINKELGLDVEDETPSTKQDKKPLEVEEGDEFDFDDAEDEEGDKDLDVSGDELPAPTEARRKVGRPRKIVDEADVKPKRSVGRPRKVVDENDIKPKRSVGRPRKIVDETDIKPKRSVGRPRKTDVENKPKRSVGRPKGSTARKVGRPRKTATSTGKRPVGRPRKTESTNKAKRPVGRPRKNA